MIQKDKIAKISIIITALQPIKLDPKLKAVLRTILIFAVILVIDIVQGEI